MEAVAEAAVVALVEAVAEAAVVASVEAAAVAEAVAEAAEAEEGKGSLRQTIRMVIFYILIFLI